MRIALVTVGTMGDLLPYIALAKGLLARGHEAFVVVPEQFKTSAESYGVPARSFGNISRDDVESVIARLIVERNFFKHPGIVANAHARGNVAEIGRATLEATRDADLIVSHNLAIMGVVAAEVLRKPLIIVHLFPNLIESRSITPDGANYGRALNALSWVVGRYIVRRSADPALNELFREFGLRERREAMLSTGHSGLLNLVAISPNVMPPDPAWPPNYHSTGFWFHDEAEFSPDATLSEFLNAGAPPVVITFGSVAEIDGAALTRAAMSAVLSTGRRAILQTEDQHRWIERLPPNIMRIGYVPHRWLFARAGCIVTHGGAGTTAAAFRAGVPPITIDHYGDQRYWGLKAERLGVGPRPLSRRSFSARALADRIRTATTDVAMRKRARALGERIRGEDGVTHAVTLIEGAMAQLAGNGDLWCV